MKRFLPLLLASALAQPLAAQSADEAQRLHDQGRECFNAGRIAEGRALTKQALDMRQKLFGQRNADYVTSLNNYALSFFLDKRYDEAVSLQNRVMQLCDSLPSPHPNLGLYSLNMGRFLYTAGRAAEAAPWWEKALPLVRKDGPEYEYLLNALGLVYSDNGNAEGQRRIMQLVEEHNQAELAKPCTDAAAMSNRAQYYAAKGQTAQAKEWYLKALGEPMADSLRMKVNTEYAHLLYQTAEHQAAAEQQKEAARLRESIDRRETTQSAEMKHRAGLYYFIGKNYRQAIDCYDQALAFYAPLSTRAALHATAAVLTDKGNALSGLKRHADARDCFARAVSICKDCPTDSLTYAKTLLRLAKAEKFAADYDASITHHREAMKLFDSLGEMQAWNDARLSLRNCYRYARRPVPADLTDEVMAQRVKDERTARLDEIIAQSEANLDLTQKYLGQMAYAQTLATLAGCQALKGEYAKAVPAFTRHMEALRQGLREAFRLQSATERMATWGQERTTLRQIREMLADTLPAAVRGEMAAVGYDAALLSKGILLNSSIEFSKVLAAQGDAALIDTYRKVQQNEATLAGLRRTASGEADYRRITQLQQQNQQLQLSLYKGCAAFADFTDYLSYSWRQVREALSEGDVAVEFMATATDSRLNAEAPMLALVLTPGSEWPAVVCIGSLAEVKALAADSLLPDRAGNPVWGPMHDIIAPARRVFFSADGVLAQTPIEYARFDGRPLSEQKEVYRLSSTKELCRRHASAKPQRAALFGDINYNLGSPALTARARQATAAMRTVGSADGLLFDDLPNTRQETSDIAALLRKARVKAVEPITDSDATKQAFLALSGSRVDILHLATHGMCRTGQKDSDDQSMRRSLLAFAGANVDTTALLTAAEVAAMDLRHCDLAVLSACETGLGRLGDDGVIGLQRGFKNAGVHTLLMSLRSVNDLATSRLMTAFYRHLLAGRTKREALVMAQQELREAGFTDASLWSPFVLLDAW